MLIAYTNQSGPKRWQTRSPVEYNLRDREVRIELLIQDYHYLDGMRGIVATTGQADLRRARALILRAIREEYAGPGAQQATSGNPFRDSVGIAEGTTIGASRPTCWCRWTMLPSMPPKYRLDKKCEICKEKERAGAR